MREKTGPITANEAREAVDRFINSHFNNPGEHARISIPADPRRDDDIRLHAFVDQAAQAIEALDSLRPLVERVRAIEPLATAYLGPGHSSYWCGADEECSICSGKKDIADACLALFSTDTKG